MKTRIALIITLVLGTMVPFFPAMRFRRGDSNAGGGLDISDPVNTLLYLYAGGADLPCKDSADANDDGKLDVSDAIHSLTFLFLDGKAPPPPHAWCGLDPTEDALDCTLLRCLPAGRAGGAGTGARA